MANIQTARAQASWATNREKLDFAEGIALLDPNENPFTLMTMKFKRGTSGNIKHSWLTDELVPEIDTTDTTTVCVTAGVTLYVDNKDRWAVGDIAMVNRTRETILITAANQSTGALTIVRDYGATSGVYTARADSFIDEEIITKIGNAFEQGHPLPTILSTTEVQMDNYCQDQRTPCGLSEVAAAAAVRGEQDWDYQMRKSGISHMRKLEYQNLWGNPMPGDKGLYVSGTGNTAPATGGGLWHFMTGASTGWSGTGSNRRVSQAEITQAEFRTWVRHVFRYGSGTKVLYAPPLLLEAIESWGIAKLNTYSQDKVYGIDISKWISPHGTLLIINHKMLEQAEGGSEGATAFAIDMADVSWITYSNIGSTRWRSLKPYESDGSTLKEGEWQTISCLELKTPKKHGVLYGMTSYAA